MRLSSYFVCLKVIYNSFPAVKVPGERVVHELRVGARRGAGRGALRDGGGRGGVAPPRRGLALRPPAAARRPLLGAASHAPGLLSHRVRHTAAVAAPTRARLCSQVSCQSVTSTR